MKSNQEVAASVFAKSREILKRKKERQKKIITAASVLGVTAFVTVFAFIGKGTLSFGGNVPVSEKPVISSESEKQYSSNISDESSLSADRNSPFHLSSDSDSMTESRNDDTSHENESDLPNASSAVGTTDSEKKSSSRRNLSSSSGSSKSEQSRSESSQNSDSKALSSSASSRNSSSKNNTSKAAPNNTSSLSNSSKNISSSTSPKNNSSKITSRLTNPDKSSSRMTGSSNVGSSTKPSNNTDSESLYPPDISDNDRPKPDSSLATDIDLPVNADTDMPVWIDSDNSGDYPENYTPQFFSVHHFEKSYRDADELTNAADRVIIGYVSGISFQTLTDENREIMKDIYSSHEIPTDIPCEENSETNAAAEPEIDEQNAFFTVYHVVVTKELTDRDLSSESDLIDIIVFGGIYSDDNESELAREQSMILKGNTIPVTDNMKPLDMQTEYMFLLDNLGGVTTLVNYDQSIYDAYDPDSSDGIYGITCREIKEVFG